MEILIEKIVPNPEQPRKFFNDHELRSLAESIAENGIILPLAVEETADGFYILHDGERRLRAAKLAGLKTVPAAVTPSLNGSGSRDRLLRALVANIQRSELTPIEEAQAYQRLIDTLGLSANQVAIRVGIGQSRVKAILSLLKLDPEIQELVGQNKLPKDKRSTDALYSVVDREKRVALAKRLAERQATVNAVVDACGRLNKHLEGIGKIGIEDIPSVRIATRRIPLDRPRWDALAQVGKLPPWVLVEISSRETCEACSLREMANETICGDCALPAMLERMIGKTAK